VSSYLTACGLIPMRFGKAAVRLGRTPDFRVLSGDSLAFYCEVKTGQEDKWLEGELAKVPPGTLAP
jgi:hypothetical protein